ncbi:PDZ domain-containing protein [Halorhabdus sp. CBA1104]|uniref:S1C family serine protease n=1 Tax=unclassified Halorhabdus TaxID=2621901 RepID=UPI0012B41DEA|nr:MULTISPECIES: trypsin-like peptidase domain-containing protein [unclassified Halorhabdus]QGN06706.1 PDZ domain-containing protein [Halorhabdus sp. CBA1104]
MSEDGVSRRGFLRTVGAATALSLAGCADSPSSGTPTQTATSDRSTQTPIELQDGDLIDGEPIDQLNDDGTARFSEVYQAVRDSVVQIRVLTASGESAGSGFIYDESHLVTNEHVVADAQDLFVRYRTTGWRDAEVVGTDVYSDLAVLRVDDHPDAAQPLPLVEADPAVGTEVIAIGNPFGLSGTVSSGIVSGVDRTLSAPNNFNIPDAIQTDAPVNPGNSGGPLVDLRGQVVGVISAGGGDNIGLAISAPLARQVIPDLIATGSYEHPYLGIGLQNVTPELAAANDMPEATGVYVTRVVTDGPADGVLRGSTGREYVYGQSVPVGGDVILRVAGQPVPTSDALASVLALGTQPGEPAELRIWRDGSEQSVEVDIGVRPQ